MKIPPVHLEFKVRIYDPTGDGEDEVEREIESMDVEDGTIWVYLKAPQ